MFFGNAHAIVWATTIAGLMLMVHLQNFTVNGAVCMQCGGKNKHRDDCPFKEKN